MATLSKRALLAAAGAGLILAVRRSQRRQRAISFHGRTVLITGARGLALVLARQLAAERARLVLCARDPEELERARRQLAPCAEVLTVPCDVTDEQQVHGMLRQARVQFGEIDVLINNAGIIQSGPMEEMTIGDYEAAMKTHFWAPLYTTLAVLPEMRRRRQGRIVNITSIGGKIAVPHLLPYSASKFAAVGLSRGLRAELAKDGILVTTVCPGLMRTGSPRNADFKGQHRAEYAWFSISDSLPVISINAERAAAQILDACRYGDAELTFTLPGRVAASLSGLFPGLTTDLLGLVNRVLPGPGGIGTAHAKGYESTSMASPSLLTRLTEQAAQRNNE